jgi:hypothetical protein
LKENEDKIRESNNVSVLSSVNGPCIHFGHSFLEKTERDLCDYHCSEERPPHGT